MDYTDVAAFAQAGKQYCDWVRAYERSDGVDAARTLQVLLLQLQLAWIGVGSHQGELSDEEVDGEDATPIRQAFCALPIDGYLKVFNPLDFEDKDGPVTSSLPDDVADIFADVAEGLQHWEQGRFFDAYWAWDQSYRLHWGRHLVSAQTVLYEYLSASPDDGAWPLYRMWNDVP